jgi:hypothetical protein
MSIPRTEAELQSAIETLFRVRAVESPPDEHGSRTIWHRGSKGADLVTWVDAFGRVTRQELYLFEDCLIWEKAVGVRTGEAEPRARKLHPSAEAIAFDSNNDDQRLGRARKALTPYAGSDKFIIHARMLVGGEEPPTEQITRTAEAIKRAQTDAELSTRSTVRVVNHKMWIALAVGFALIAVALVLLARAG